MLVEIIHVRPSRWDQDRQTLKSALQDSTMAAVLVDRTIDWDTLADMARVVTASKAPFVATYGERGLELHDLVDVMLYRYLSQVLSLRSKTMESTTPF